MDLNKLEKRVEELERNSHPPVDWNVDIYLLKNKVKDIEKVIKRCLNTKGGT